MSENTEATEAQTETPKKPSGSNRTAPAVDKTKLSRRTLRKASRKKRAAKLREDAEYAKAYFEGKSKRSAERKVGYRRRHVRK